MSVRDIDLKAAKVIIALSEIDVVVTVTANI